MGGREEAWPEEDLVDVHVFRLTHGEGDSARERVGRNRDTWLR
jgi:hypothetical protein